jgi:spore maturation protein SpmA
MATRPALKEAATPWGLQTSLDLYDCNPDKVAAFTREFFEAGFVEVHVTKRM